MILLVRIIIGKLLFNQRNNEAVTVRPSTPRSVGSDNVSFYIPIIIFIIILILIFLVFILDTRSS